MGQAAISMQQQVNPAEQASSLSPAEKIHEMQRHQFAEDYDDFNEGPTRKIKTGYGEGCIADFRGKQGLLKSEVTGCRATMLNSIHQFTVTCKCPPGIFKEAKPVFEKIVSSVGGGSGM